MPDKVVKLLLDLLKIKGPSRQERPVADFILKHCKRIGANAKEDGSARRIKGSAGNLLAWPRGTKPDKASLMLCAHMDTVDVGPSPAGVVKGGRIVTNGKHPAGIDNRLGVALLLALLSEKKGDFICAFTAQEEIGMFGAEALAVPKGVKQIVVLDGSSFPGHGVLGTAGGLTFKAVLTGLASHAGINPNGGKSAILMASRAISRLTLGMPGPEVSVNIGVIQGGTRSNVIPARAEVIGEVRADSHARIMAEVGKVKAVFAEEAKKIGGLLEFSFQYMFRPYAHSPKSPIIARLSAAMEKEGLKPCFSHYRGGSDANVFNQRGMPAVNISISAHNPHSEKEYADLREIGRIWRVVLNLAG